MQLLQSTTSNNTSWSFQFICSCFYSRTNKISICNLYQNFVFHIPHWPTFLLRMNKRTKIPKEYEKSYKQKIRMPQFFSTAT